MRRSEDQYAQVIILLICTQAAAAPATARAAQFAELKWQLNVADDEITLVNKRLDEVQGMSLGHSVHASIIK